MSEKKVLIIMGSDSDLKTMEACFKQLEDFSISYETHICSAHRTPKRAADFAEKAEERGFDVIVAAAGLAAHLPGVLAAGTVLPVIGVPLASGALSGLDALLAEVQMPTGIPVATVAIDGAANAAILAAQIIATKDPAIRTKLHEFKQNLKEKVIAKDEALQESINRRSHG